MTLRPFLFAALIPAVALAGCMGTKNRGLESVHQPVVSRADYALDLATGGGNLARGERQRLAWWLTGLRLGYGDRVAIDDPAGEGPAVRAAVADVVADYGLLLADASTISPAAVAPGTIRVVVSRMRATVPGCPDWSRDSSIDYEQNTSSNYGCSVNSNLAAMVASPQDLVHGVSAGGVNDPASASKPIDGYRKATLTGGGGNTVKAESAKGGN